MDIKKILNELCEAVGVAGIDSAAKASADIL